MSRKVLDPVQVLLSNNENISVLLTLFSAQIPNTAPHQLLIRKLPQSKPTVCVHEKCIEMVFLWSYFLPFQHGMVSRDLWRSSCSNRACFPRWLLSIFMVGDLCQCSVTLTGKCFLTFRGNLLCFALCPSSLLSLSLLK